MARKSFPPDVCLFPTPIVFVTTVDEKGKPNIITLAWVGVVNTKPPMVGISIRPTAYSNTCLKASKEFVANIPSEDMVKELNICGSASGRDKDKFALLGWKPVPAEKVKPPLIDECAIQMECKVKMVIPLGSHDLFLGEVVSVHKKEEVLHTNGNVDLAKFSPVVYFPRLYEYRGLGKFLGHRPPIFQKRQNNT